MKTTMTSHGLPLFLVRQREQDIPKEKKEAMKKWSSLDKWKVLQQQDEKEREKERDLERVRQCLIPFSGPLYKPCLCNSRSNILCNLYKQRRLATGTTATEKPDLVTLSPSASPAAKGKTCSPYAHSLQYEGLTD
jgi:hypothetical protein